MKITIGEGRGVGKTLPLHRMLFYGSIQFQLGQSIELRNNQSIPASPNTLLHTSKLPPILMEADPLPIPGNPIVGDTSSGNIRMMDAFHQRNGDTEDYEIIILDLLPYLIGNLKKNTLPSIVTDASKALRKQIIHQIKREYNKKNIKKKLKVKYIGCEGEESLWEYLENKKNKIHTRTLTDGTVITGIFLFHPSNPFVSSQTQIVNKINYLTHKINTERPLIKLFLLQIHPEGELNHSGSPIPSGQLPAITGTSTGNTGNPGSENQSNRASKKIQKILKIKATNKSADYPREHTLEVELKFTKSQHSGSGSNYSTENEKEIQEKVISFYFQRINADEKEQTEKEAPWKAGTTPSKRGGDENSPRTLKERDGHEENTLQDKQDELPVKLLPSHPFSFPFHQKIVLKSEEIEFLKKYSIFFVYKKQKKSTAFLFDDRFLFLQKISKDSSLFHFYYQKMVNELLNTYKSSINVSLNGYLSYHSNVTISRDTKNFMKKNQIIKWRNEDFIYFMELFSRSIEYLYLNKINENLFPEFDLDLLFDSNSSENYNKITKILKKSVIKGVRVNTKISQFSLEQFVSKLLKNQLFTKLELVDCRKLKNENLKTLYSLFKGLSVLSFKNCDSIRFHELNFSKFNILQFEKFEFGRSALQKEDPPAPPNFDNIKKLFSKKNVATQTLQSIQLPNEFFNQRIFEDFIASVPNLLCLNLSSCQNIHEFKCLGKLKSLKELNLAFTFVSSGDLEYLSDQFSHLLRLNITSCLLTKKTLPNFAKYNKNLRELVVDRAFRENKYADLDFYDAFNQSLSSSLPSLLHIRFLSIQNALIYSSFIDDLAVHCPFLKYVDFTGCSFASRDSISSSSHFDPDRPSGNDIILKLVNERKDLVVYFPSSLNATQNYHLFLPSSILPLN